MEYSDFVHLHVHSEYSLLDGAIRIKKLVERAAQYNMSAVALTDHGAMYGAVEFYEAALAKGVKPIVGCEVYVAPDSRFDRSPGADGESSYHLVLLVKNAKGYKNLCRLVSMGYIEGFYRKPRIDHELLERHNDGLIAMSACMKGEIPSFILSGKNERARHAADFYKKVFGDRFYIEIQKNGIDGQDALNEKLVKLAREMEIQIVATNDCHYLDREDAEVQDILLCIQTGKTVDDSNRMRFQTEEIYFKSPDEMKKLFRDFPEAVSNTLEVAERCNLELDLGKFHFPVFELAEGETLEERLNGDTRSGLDDRLRLIEKRHGELSDERKQQYRDRLEYELEIINKMGFAGYFLIVADFIRYAREKGIPVGPGRGSAAGSLVAYSLLITNLDPIEYGLLFERFLNPERRSMPDIDVDFCMRRREEVYQYVREKYGGSDHVAQIITFGSMNAKAAIRDVGRALSMSYTEVDRLAKLVPNVLNITLENAFKQESRFNQQRAEDPRVDRLLRIAEGLEGLSRHSSTHAAGVVISDKPIIEYLPLCVGTRDEVVTQYGMKSVERIGLIKFDFLGLKTLTHIHLCVELINKTKGEELDIDNLPMDDPAVWELLGSGDADGVFQLESSGMKEILVKLKPTTFDDLVAVVALYRPGPLGSGMVEDFIKRKHGKVEITYPHPRLDKILKETYGIILYQEQVMLIARELAGYSRGDADVLRKAMGKKITEVMAGEREKFVQGAVKSKVNENTAQKIFKQMEEFGKYGFNKSHSAAYAFIAYQTAYLKARYPVEFMAALLSVEMENTDNVVKYINSCREMKIEILPPDVNASDKEFTIENDAIRFGLLAVKNVGSGAIDAILEARSEGGPFRDIFDFASRADLHKVNKKVIESLIKCGAFDSTGDSRGGMIEVSDQAVTEGQARARERKVGQESLFGELGMPENAANSAVPKVSLAENQSLQYEKEALGFYMSGHPLARFERDMKMFATHTTDEAPFAPDGINVRVAGVVSDIREMLNKKGERMAFVTIGDLNGFIEVIVWADLYKKTVDLLRNERPLLVGGKLESKVEKPRIIADTIISLEEAPVKLCSALHLKVNSFAADKADIEKLRDMLKSHPGGCPVFLHVVIPGRSETILSLPDNLKVLPKMELIKGFEKVFGEKVEVHPNAT